jgi:biotin carboxyl carrier protein
MSSRLITVNYSRCHRGINMGRFLIMKFTSNESSSLNKSWTQPKTEIMSGKDYSQNEDDEYEQEDENAENVSKEINLNSVTEYDDDDSGNNFDLKPDSDEDNTNLKKVHMPSDLGKGKVVKWYASVGDIIKYDDVLVDIETNDFVMGMSHDDFETMTMHKISVPALQIVEPGDVLCILRREGKEEVVEK